MVRSHAATVAQYLAELPADRRAQIAAVRKVVRAHLPRGYVETINWGAISYEVPLRTYPRTYNGQPLSFAGLAAQKHYNALYLSCVYQDSEALDQLRAAFASAGKKLDMGKSCIRFKQPDDLPLAAIGKLIRRTPVATFIRVYEASRASVLRAGSRDATRRGRRRA